MFLHWEPVLSWTIYSWLDSSPVPSVSHGMKRKVSQMIRFVGNASALDNGYLCRTISELFRLPCGVEVSWRAQHHFLRITPAAD